jgi:hypothetical protein
MKRVVLLLLALAVALPAFAGKAIFSLSDPRGDDHGDGNLVYPLNEDLDEGELDLISLKAEADGDGTSFEATFAKPVRVPGREAIDDLGTPLDTVARFGFYTMNLDIYIDTDRVPGSGAVSTLPGRLATIDPASAWEKAIVLTPRPHEARGEIKRMMNRAVNDEMKKEDSTLEEEEAAAMQAQIPVDVEGRIFFPTKVKVRGNKVTFFVPGSFLGGPAKDSWSYVVAVSGANVLQSFDISRALGRQSDKEEALMILPVSPGKWNDRFGGGRENAAIQPPLVDIVVPEGKKQENVLGEFNQRRKEPVVLPGVVPKG